MFTQRPVHDQQLLCKSQNLDKNLNDVLKPVNGLKKLSYVHTMEYYSSINGLNFRHMQQHG